MSDDARPSAERTTKSDSFSRAERAAMQARARELKAEARAARKREAGEQAVAAAIADMPEPDRILAQRVHDIVTDVAPDLWPKTWYGMPAYAREGKTVVTFFQGAAKFEARYATIGFNDAAKLDAGAMWPVSFAVTEIGDAEAATITELVQRAVSA